MYKTMCLHRSRRQALFSSAQQCNYLYKAPSEASHILPTTDTLWWGTCCVISSVQSPIKCCTIQNAEETSGLEPNDEDWNHMTFKSFYNPNLSEIFLRWNEQVTAWAVFRPTVLCMPAVKKKDHQLCLGNMVINRKILSAFVNSKPTNCSLTSSLLQFHIWGH